MPEASVRVAVRQLLFSRCADLGDFHSKVKHHPSQRMIGIQCCRLVANRFDDQYLRPTVRSLRLQLHAHGKILDAG